MSLLLALALMGFVAQSPQRLLEIEAVAFDRQGNPVADLKPGDLEVWINGRRIPILGVRPGSDRGLTPSAGRLIVLLLDDVTVDPGLVPRVREVARRFVNRMLPEDRMAIVPLSGGLVEITSDTPKLLARADAYNRTAGFIGLDRLGAQVLTTVASVARQMGEVPARRRSIVAVGSGWLLDTPIPAPQIGAEVRREWLDAVAAMAGSDVRFYVIDPAGVGATRAARGDNGFARDSGGHAFINTNDLAGAVQRILRETDHYYLIRVEDPPFGRTAPFRELDVRSLRRGITIRARRMLPGGEKIPSAQHVP